MKANYIEGKCRVNGQTLAYKHFQSKLDAPVIIALHGWLDNAASFDCLAPFLQNNQLICLDLPGHGLSEHRAEGAEYYIWSYVCDVIAFADSLNLQHFSLLGHSMGGAIACLVSSLYPERITSLALLDAVAPLTTAGVDAPEQMRKALKQKKGLNAHSARTYPTQQLAIEARAKKGLTYESAKLLAVRGLAQQEKGFYWANDPRLARVNLMSMTPDQVSAFFERIICPVQLIAAEDNWNRHVKRFNDYLAILSKKHSYKVFKLEGNHHLHMEGPVKEVANLLNAFWAGNENLVNQ